MIETLIEWLNAGGNVAMIFAAIGLWRVDRRVVRIETHLFGPEGVKE